MRFENRRLVESVRTQLDEISRDLLKGEQVQPVPANPDISYLLELGEGLWKRAKNVESDSRIYVDGYWGQCHWNSAMTAVRYPGGMMPNRKDIEKQIIESPLRIFRGFAYFFSNDGLENGWAMHGWCMEGKTILETTGPMSAYFGAELNDSERRLYAKLVSGHDPTARNRGQGWSLLQNGKRDTFSAADVQATIGLKSIPRETNDPAHSEQQVYNVAPKIVMPQVTVTACRKWRLDGFSPVESKSKSEARALFKKQGPIPPGAKIESVN